jgi:transcriptional regulator NrdR family protein
MSDHADRGLRCPRCGCGHFYVTHTERLRLRIRRRRVCRHCGRRIVTFEAASAIWAAQRREK